MYHDTFPDKQIIVHGDNIMGSMTYSKTKTWRQSYVVNVPRLTSRQAKKFHGDNIMWSMTYTNTKTWRQSEVVSLNVPRLISRQAKKIKWR